MAVVHANGSVRGTDSSAAPQALRYQVLYRSGENVGGWPAGQIVDRSGKPLLLSGYDDYARKAQGPFFAKGPDSNSLLEFPVSTGGKGSGLFLVTHFEYDTDAPMAGQADTLVGLYGKLPMAINVAALTQDNQSGALRAETLSNVDMKAVDGLWTPCAGERTPWNTHLGSEEYEPDARTFERSPLEPMNLYLGTPGKLASQGGANPYAYGYITEVTVKPSGVSQIVKHYAMGRFAHEMGAVMPDRRTVYLSDDGRDVMLGMFVADKAGDLSAGTLYAAKWLQQDASGAGRAKLQWIRLGHASSKEIKQLLQRKLRFSQIFDYVMADAYQLEPQRYAGYKPVYVYTGTGGATQLEYLKIKPGMEKAAAFLETRRYAAYRGATTEFTKMEGLTVNPKARTLYASVSYIEAGMLAADNGNRVQDDIALAGSQDDLACGAVYASNLVQNVRDNSGQPIRSNWVAADMSALLQGAAKPAGQTAYGQHDRCDSDRIGNPDNIKYSAEMDTLFIGEDSGNHLNNLLWAYQPGSGTLTRLASAPAGAEWTGLHPVVTRSGYAYLMANIQHPGAEGDLRKYPDSISRDLAAKIDKRGTVGYFPLGKLKQ